MQKLLALSKWPDAVSTARGCMRHGRAGPLLAAAGLGWVPNHSTTASRSRRSGLLEHSLFHASANGVYLQVLRV